MLVVLTYLEENKSCNQAKKISFVVFFFHGLFSFWFIFSCFWGSSGANKFEENEIFLNK
jgi:hypothetical protein